MCCGSFKSLSKVILKFIHVFFLAQTLIMSLKECEDVKKKNNYGSKPVLKPPSLPRVQYDIEK